MPIWIRPPGHDRFQPLEARPVDHKRLVAHDVNAVRSALLKRLYPFAAGPETARSLDPRRKKLLRLIHRRHAVPRAKLFRILRSVLADAAKLRAGVQHILHKFKDMPVRASDDAKFHKIPSKLAAIRSC